QEPAVADVDALVAIAPVELLVIGIFEVSVVRVKVGVGDDTRWWIGVLRWILSVVIEDHVFERIVTWSGRRNDEPAGPWHRRDRRALGPRRLGRTRAIGPLCRRCLARRRAGSRIECGRWCRRRRWSILWRRGLLTPGEFRREQEQARHQAGF